MKSLELIMSHAITILGMSYADATTAAYRNKRLVFLPVQH
jgi:hypothetical protein